MPRDGVADVFCWCKLEGDDLLDAVITMVETRLHLYVMETSCDVGQGREGTSVKHVRETDVHNVYGLPWNGSLLPCTRRPHIEYRLLWKAIRLLLANHLRKHYTTTSLSPLKTKDNDVSIDEVYTEANLKKQVQRSKKNDEKRQNERYRDIFESQGTIKKRIYLLGEVGTGKTAFCQMLISKWCGFILGDPQRDSEVLEMMKQYDFVFYLPLRKLQRNGRLKEMIKWYYKNEVSEVMVDRLLNEMPEKCLILADGLDEWKPSPDGQHRPDHVTDGIPDAEDIKDVTLITTSRPSAPGVLNMKSTEYDRKIILSGIKTKAVDVMAQRYCAKLDIENKADVLQRLKDLDIKDIENMPLALKQIVWMLGKGFSIAPGISGLYSDIMKIAVKWAYDKYKQEISHFDLYSRFSGLILPEQLGKVPEEFQKPVVVLSQMAFDMLSSDTNQIFGRNKLRKYGIDNNQIQAMLEVGLLSEDSFENPMEENTQFYFPHTSFIEYFSAVFIASQAVRPSSDGAGDHLDGINRLEKLFKKCHSIEDVSHLKTTLKFVCGLSPDLTQCVCQNVYSIAQSDEKYNKQRDKLFTDKGTMLYTFGSYFWAAEDIQRLIADCVTECKKSNNSTTLQIPVLDLFAFDKSYLAIHNYVDEHFMQHMFFCEPELPEYKHSVFPVDCTRFKHLKMVALMTECSDGVDPELIMENLQISRLEKLYMDGRIISGTYRGELCKNLQVAAICNIKLTTHNELSDLLNIIANATMLRFIKIEKLFCFECNQDCHHVVDFSQFDKLQTLHLGDVGKLLIKEINKTNLQYVSIGQGCQEIAGKLRNSPKLTNLTIQCMFPGTTFKKEMNEDICTCTKLQEITLVQMDIQTNALQLHSDMESLSSIELFVSMSESTFIMFVESLLTLRQSVTVKVELLNQSVSECFTAYLRKDHEKFLVLSEANIDFTFKTLK